VIKKARHNKEVTFLNFGAFPIHLFWQCTA